MGSLLDKQGIAEDPVLILEGHQSNIKIIIGKEKKHNYINT